MDKFLIKEVPIKKDGFEFSVYDEAVSGTVDAVIGSWNERDQVDLDNPQLILDIGANIGIWSFYMALKYPKSFIMAMEPMIRNVHCFRMGIDTNKIQNVALFKAAIGNEDKVLLRSHKSNSGSASAYIPPWNNFREETCDAVTLEKLFEDITQDVDLMKMDIEGAEYHVFEGFTHWDQLKALTLELHPWPQFKTPEEQQEKTDKLIELIKAGMGDKPFKFTYPELHDEEDFHKLVQPGLKKFDKEVKRLDLA